MSQMKVNFVECLELDDIFLKNKYINKSRIDEDEELKS